MLSDLYLVVMHDVTSTKCVALNAYAVPPDASGEDMSEVIERFKREQLAKDETEGSNVEHSFRYVLQTRADRGGSGGLEWPLL